MFRSFNFKNIATVYASDIEEAKKFLMSNLKINNEVEMLRKEAESKEIFSSFKYYDTYTEEDVNSITETNYNKVYAYILKEDVLEEDIPYIYDTKPNAMPKPLVSLPLSKVMKYDSYKKVIEGIEVPSISYWMC